MIEKWQYHIFALVTASSFIIIHRWIQHVLINFKGGRNFTFINHHPPTRHTKHYLNE